MDYNALAILIVIVNCFFGSFGSVLLKMGSKNFTRDLKKFFTNYKLFLGLFIYGLSSIVFVIALQWGELSVLYPLVSTTYIWVAILSVKLLGEKMNKLKLLGILLIICGVILIGLSM